MKQTQQTQQQKTPCDRNDTQLRCHICKSVYHVAQNCPEKYDNLYTHRFPHMRPVIARAHLCTYLKHYRRSKKKHALSD